MQQTRQEGPDYHCQVPQIAVSLQHDKANACSQEDNDTYGTIAKAGVCLPSLI